MTTPKKPKASSKVTKEGRKGVQQREERADASESPRRAHRTMSHSADPDDADEVATASHQVPTQVPESQPVDLAPQAPRVHESEVVCFDPLRGFFVSEAELVAAATIHLDGLLHRGQGAAGTDSAVEYLTFSVGGEEYAIEIVEIQEIIKVPSITAVPRTHRSLLGITSLRGTIVPVLDLRIVLRLSEYPVARQTRILVVKGGGDPVGLLVDRVSSVVRIDREGIEPIPHAMQREAFGLLHGVGRLAEQMLIVLDVAAVLSVMEQAA